MFAFFDLNRRGRNPIRCNPDGSAKATTSTPRFLPGKVSSRVIYSTLLAAQAKMSQLNLCRR
jgi:hypothetical protein